MFCKVSLMNHFAEAPSLFDDYDLQVIERPVPTIVDGHRQRLRDRFTTCGATSVADYELLGSGPIKCLDAGLSS